MAEEGRTASLAAKDGQKGNSPRAVPGTTLGRQTCTLNEELQTDGGGAQRLIMHVPSWPAPSGLDESTEKQHRN